MMQRNLEKEKFDNFTKELTSNLPKKWQSEGKLIVPTEDLSPEKLALVNKVNTIGNLHRKIEDLKKQFQENTKFTCKEAKKELLKSIIDVFNAAKNYQTIKGSFWQRDEAKKIEKFMMKDEDLKELFNQQALQVKLPTYHP